jgi:D-alanyl-D-alanine carboxypeptidase (penicillin-binding protein 5/6)
MARRLFAALALAAAVLLAPPALAAVPPAPPKAAAPGTAAAGPPKLADAKAWIVIDARDGTALAAKGADRKLPIASTTKLMTAYLALQRLRPEQKLRAPRYEAQDAESLLGLRVGERMTVRDLLFALVLQSANDAAETLAVGVSGSTKAFVRQMNRAAQALGLSSTHYSTPVGLDEPGNHSSARDLVTLADRLLENPLFAKAADSATATLKSGDRPRRIDTRNLLLNSYPFVTGVKTGHTLDAGYVLVGSGERKGTTLISAVLGTPSEGARDADTVRLLQYGFSQYTPATPVKQGTKLNGPELDYGRGKLELEASKSIRVSTRPGERVATEVDVPAELRGGVEKGRRIGQIRVTVDGRAAGSSPLLAAETVAPAGLFRKAISALSSPFLLLPLGLLVLVAGLLLARRGTRPGPPPAASGRGLPGSGPGSNGDRRSPEPVEPQPGDNRQRTPAERERMRQQRMKRRSRQESPGAEQ